MSEPPDGRPADLEIAGSWSARSARRSRPTQVRTQVAGDLVTEELSEREPPPGQPTGGGPAARSAGRWRFAAWLRDLTR